jgi:hypothetical protein
MHTSTTDMKKEQIITIAGVAALMVAYLLPLPQAPVVLPLLAIAGALLSWRYPLAGGVLQFSGGAALVVHPLLFYSSPWLIPGGALLAIAGVLQLVRWWMKEEE